MNGATKLRPTVLDNLFFLEVGQLNEMEIR